MNRWLAFLIVFGAAFLSSLILTPYSMQIGKRFGIVAVAGGRRQTEGDKRNVPKSGIIAMYLSFTLAVIIAQFLPITRTDSKEITRVIGLLLGGAVIFIIGLLDDIYEFRAATLFLVQGIAACIAIAFLIFIEKFNNPFTGMPTDNFPFAITFIITFSWLLGMMNTVNFLDGLDGLAMGVAVIAGVMLFINSAFDAFPPQTSVSLLHLALIGTCLGFLRYNFYPARIFMGGGAYFLGYLLGTLSIIGGAKMAVILLVMGLPIMDMAWQVANRLYHGRNPFKGDRGHLHFRLLDIGFSQRQIVLTYYVFCAFFGMLTLVIDSRLYKFIALAVSVVLLLLGFGILLYVEKLKPSEET